MGYPNSVYSPSAKSAGQTITAAFFNDPDTEITALETALIGGSGLQHTLVVGSTYGLSVAGNSTLAGGLQVGGASTLAGAVTLGGAVTCSTTVTAAAQPRVYAGSSGTLNLSTFASTGNVIKFDQTLFNVGNGYSTATGVFTAPVGGLYLAETNIYLGAGAQTGNLYLSTRGASSGGEAIVGRSHFYSASSIVQYLSVMGLFALSANETIHVQLVQNSTENRTVGDAAGGMRFQVVKLWL